MIVGQFVKWIFVKMFAGLIELNSEFRSVLRRETGLAIFMWFILSLVSSLGFLVIFAGIDYLLDAHLPIQIWFGYMWLCVAYLIYTAFSVMYNEFKRERAELFETIKNGR